MFQTRIIKKQLHFKQPAGTSRGVYTTRNVWYILLTDTDNRYYGVGECAPLPALSCDDVPNYDELLAIACKNFEKTGKIDREALLPYPSILFGLETALLHFRACSLQFWHTPFSKGKAGIPINGLIWMGSFDEMYRRIEEKMQKGFRCIKLKIGAIDFEKELELLAHIRRHFTPEQIELRVDANGAFTPTDALDKFLRCLHSSSYLLATDILPEIIAANQFYNFPYLLVVPTIPVISSLQSHLFVLLYFHNHSSNLSGSRLSILSNTRSIIGFPFGS